MTTPPNSFRPGRPPKRRRSEAEIQDAANRFAADWVPGDSVGTWLNRHEGGARELSDLIVDGWSWADVSRALFEAGICYRTGRPIPEETLRAKAYRARQKHRPKQPAPAAPSREIPTVPMAEEKPVFAFARMVDPYRPPKETTGHKMPVSPPMPAADVTPEAIWTRVFGRKPSG
jgi:hypothetical protein